PVNVMLPLTEEITPPLRTQMPWSRPPPPVPTAPSIAIVAEPVERTLDASTKTAHFQMPLPVPPLPCITIGALADETSAPLTISMPYLLPPDDPTPPMPVI